MCKETRERAKRILKDGISNMSIERLIQMPQFGLMGNVVLSDGIVSIENVFNRISYNEESSIITLSAEESRGSYGSISFSIDAVTDISGCEDKENPEEYLNVNIKLENGIEITIKILY